jgi:hypothetical protein
MHAYVGRTNVGELIDIPQLISFKSWVRIVKPVVTEINVHNIDPLIEVKSYIIQALAAWSKGNASACYTGD